MFDEAFAAELLRLDHLRSQARRGQKAGRVRRHESLLGWAVKLEAGVTKRIDQLLAERSPPRMPKL